MAAVNVASPRVTMSGPDRASFYQPCLNRVLPTSMLDLILQEFNDRFNESDGGYGKASSISFGVSTLEASLDTTCSNCNC
ncbi:hypothetical protein QQ045_001038 [Rhodiola kirilowii]